MKTTQKNTTFLSITIASLALLIGAGCNQNKEGAAPSQPKAEKSAVKNSFEEVTSKLDPGGNLYVYLSTEKWVSGLSDKISSWREVVKSIPSVSAEDQGKIMRVFDVAVNLVKDSGIEDVSGVGLSSIEKETNWFRTKFVLHHYKGQGTGYIWTMFGKAPHPLDGLDLAPANSAVASFMDFDLPLLWSEINKQVDKLGMPEVKENFDKVPEGFAKVTGLKLDDVLASLGNEYGLVITLNDTNKISLPIANKPMEVAEPGLLLAVKVKNDVIFNRVDELLKNNQAIVKVDKDGVKMRTMPVPLPLPMAVRPTIARSGDYLFVASSDALVTEALAVKSGKKPGLKSTDEFKKLSQDMPDSGNQFSFVSKRFGQTWADVQSQVVEAKEAAGAGAEALINKLMGMRGAPVQSYSVGVNGEEGWVGTGSGNQDTSKIALLPAVAVPAVGAGLLLPALAKAKDKAQTINCINNLKQIQLAKKMWADDNNKSDNDVPTWKDLKQYLPAQPLKCPKEGTYRINRVGAKPTCSIPGHALSSN
jgi:hypothetical protein